MWYSRLRFASLVIYVTAVLVYLVPPRTRTVVPSDEYRRRKQDGRCFVKFRPLESSYGIFTVFYGIPENRIPVFCFGISRYSTTSNNGIRRCKYRNCIGVLTVTLAIVSAVRAARCSWYRVRRNNVRGIRIHTSRTRYRVCLLYTSPSPRDRQKSRMPSSA